jgi:hypothetical protein
LDHKNFGPLGSEFRGFLGTGKSFGWAARFWVYNNCFATKIKKLLLGKSFGMGLGQDNSQGDLKQQGKSYGGSSKRMNKLNILEIQRFDASESRSKNIIGSPKSERDSHCKYISPIGSSKRGTETPKRCTANEVNRHGSPNLGKTNFKQKSNETKRKQNLSEEYNHRRKVWEKVINTKMVDTKKKLTPDFKNIMNSKCFNNTKETNPLTKKQQKKPSFALATATQAATKTSSTKPSAQNDRDKDPKKSEDPQSSSISKVRQILSSYRKKIRSGGSLTHFGGGNSQNPTLLCTNNENINHTVGISNIINHNNFNMITSGRRHRASNSNGNMYT